MAAVYYLARDGKRYTFPNETVFLSWYKDFTVVRRVTDATLASLSVGGNVTVRPGTFLVKIVSDPKVYAVEPGSVLRPIATEAIAHTLYGADWILKVRDIDPTLFGNYAIGDAMLSARYPLGTLLEQLATGVRYYVAHEGDVRVVRRIVGDAFAQNRFDARFIIRATFSIPIGTSITGPEDALSAPALP